MSKQRRIVCAANRYGGEVVIAGVRHYDMIMHRTIAGIGVKNLPAGEEQGFLDNMGVFVNRHEAYCIAVAANQIIQKTGNPDQPILYSEDVW